MISAEEDAARVPEHLNAQPETARLTQVRPLTVDEALAMWD
jgi:hypothetical protein